MHKPKIFLVGDDPEHLITLEETDYLKEATLQNYLVDHPDLLPGDQIDPENPRRWLLVAQEMGVPGEEEGSGRWSLDHLFLDQDGIPTFVECKRAADTRTRREVVAQMLDYAANGVEYWDMDRMRQVAAETAQRRGQPLDEEIADLLGGGEEDIEGYWDMVEANLRAHRVRLVFVADRTPKELRRLVEFLNEEMANVEVLALEIKQFRRGGGKGQTALVPRVVGLTEAAREKSIRPQKRPLTQDEFFARCSPSARPFFERMLKLAQERDHAIEWGKISFSVRAHLPTTGKRVTFAYGWLANRLDVYLQNSELFPPEQEETIAFRQTLLDSGLFEPSGRWTLIARVDENNLTRVKEIYDSILDKVDEFLATYETGEDTE